MEVLTVTEAIEKIKGETTALGRFSKKNFNTLLKALANDINFSVKVANVKGGELENLEEIMVTKNFRNWCKRLVEKAGVDKNESERVLTDAFQIDNVDGLYEFFATAVYKYCECGNKFSFLPTEDFKGSIAIKPVEESTSVGDAYSPKDRTFLGTYETTKKAHKVLVAKSSCPEFLRNRKKIK